MYAVTVTFTLRAGTRDAFLPLMQANARASLEQEPGCRQFDVCSNGDDVIFLYELYDDADAFQTHLQSTHFKSFDAEVAGMIADKSVATFTQVTQ
ncbi:putative quinol monooxygenase [Marinovum sp.]|uniref:putative quinol monooxygenase n=1 Tax=Marinovum sp. TaxID=2024839 RepID=UPI002B278F71|nr:putative quinol monooxygenase [Marinovum sp.]